MTMSMATVSSERVSLSSGGQEPRYVGLDTRIVLPVVLCLVFLVLILALIHFWASRVLHRHRLRLAATSILPVRDPAHAERLKVTGLKPSAIAALPTFAYAQEGEAAECSICLSFVEKGEVVRMIPGCRHMFHVDCIDMWLRSHSRCPLCRADAETPQTEEVVSPPGTSSSGGPEAAKEANCV